MAPGPALLLSRCLLLLQVHAAVLRGSNKEVVIKVLKPGVQDVLTTDLDFILTASKVGWPCTRCLDKPVARVLLQPVAYASSWLLTQAIMPLSE